MNEFAAIVVDAHKGQTIQIAASGFKTEDAEVMLLRQANYKRFQRDYERESSTVIIPFTQKVSVSPSSPTAELPVPHGGSWVVLYQPHTVSVTASTR